MNTQQLLSQVMTEDDAFYYSLYTRTLCCTLCHYKGTVKVYMNWCAVVQSVGVEQIAPAAPLKFQEPLWSTMPFPSPKKGEIVEDMSEFLLSLWP